MGRCATRISDPSQLTTSGFCLFTLRLSRSPRRVAGNPAGVRRRRRRPPEEEPVEEHDGVGEVVASVPVHVAVPGGDARRRGMDDDGILRISHADLTWVRLA